MPGIKVVAFIVRCTHSLLLCEDVPSDHLRFADAEDCRTQLARILREPQLQTGADFVVMGRCRFQLDRLPSPDRRPETVPSG